MAVSNIEGVGKGLVLLAPIHEVIKLQTNPIHIVAPVVHSVGGGRAGMRSGSQNYNREPTSVGIKIDTTRHTSNLKQQLHNDSTCASTSQGNLQEQLPNVSKSTNVTRHLTENHLMPVTKFGLYLQSRLKMAITS